MNYNMMVFEDIDISEPYIEEVLEKKEITLFSLCSFSYFLKRFCCCCLSS